MATTIYLPEAIEDLHSIWQYTMCRLKADLKLCRLSTAHVIYRDIGAVSRPKGLALVRLQSSNSASANA